MFKPKDGGLEPLKILNEIQGSTMKLREGTNEKKKRNRNSIEQNSQALIHTGADPHRFPPLRESVRFFIINIFLIIIII